MEATRSSAPDLSGMTIAIPGATGSLGLAVARRLLAAGARVSLGARSRGRLDALTAVLGGTADTEALDLRDEPAVRRWAERLQTQFGGIDAVLHLVGGWRGGQQLESEPTEDWEELSNLLVETTRVVIRAFTPHLLASGGRFAIVSTGQARAPSASAASYGAAKAAAEAWTLALADRCRGTGATANIVVITAIVTEAMRTAEPERSFDTFVADSEIADTFCFLLSEAARAMNGQRIELRGAH